jgi:hypothetical protein
LGGGAQPNFARIIHQAGSLRLQKLALEVGFRVATGFHERPVYRDLFPRGLTALDTLCDLVPATDPIRPIR